jgi:uncharacterized membrane protein (DUF2068 family)
MTAAAPSSTHHHGNKMLLVIGVFKLLKSVLLFATAIGALRLVHDDAGNVLLKAARWFHVAPGNRYLQDLLAKTLSISKHQWELLASVLASYGLMYGIEGIGLILQKHWAEWMTVITTAGLIPFEIYENVHRFGVGKLLALIINLAVLIYLIYFISQKKISPNET